MTIGPEPEQPTARTCPSCANPVSESARFCPTCGHRFIETAPDGDIARWLQAAWRVFVSDAPLSIGIGLLAVALPIAFFVICYFGVFATAILADPKTHAARGAVAIPLSIMGLMVLGLAFVGPALQGGVYACFLEGLRTGRLTAHHLGRGFRHWWACTWTAWVLFAASGLCWIFCFLLVGIPAAVAVATLGWLSLLHIVDRERGGLEALAFAWNALRGRFWMMLVYTLLVSVLASAGAMAMYIGVVVSVPIGIAAYAAGYDDLLRKIEGPPGA